MIGIWGFMDDAGKASQKISREDAVHVSTTLADAVAQAAVDVPGGRDQRWRRAGAFAGHCGLSGLLCD